MLFRKRLQYVLITLFVILRAHTTHSQQIVDPCFNTITPLGKFHNSGDIVNLCGTCGDNSGGANLVEWNGTEWLGQLPYSYVQRPPPPGCNARAFWMGYRDWTPGGEGVALKLDEPLTPGREYKFSFTYALDGRNRDDLGPNLTFSPIVYTSLKKPYYIQQSYKVGRLPATVNWTTQSISFTAAKEQNGHDWVIIHALETSGSILADCRIDESLIQPRDTTVCIGTDVTLQTKGDAYEEYYWNTGATKPSITISEPGIYSLKIKNHLCESADSIIVKYEDCVPRLTMPNMFSPNDDFFNPAFVPMDINYIDSGIMVIFNRWGKEIFSGDIFTGWTGEGAARGVYFYRIVYKDRKSATYEQKGVVTLLR